MAKKNELAVLESFQLVNRYEGMDEDLRAELEDELVDLEGETGIDIRDIKVPSGGGLAYIVEGDDPGDEEYVKEIEAVVVYTHRVNAYWPNAFGSSADPEARIPVCSSMDGKFGLDTTSGERRSCESCPYNQYGTAQNGGKGKACKNMRRLYMVMSGDPNIYLLTVPPTSMKEVGTQLAKAAQGKGIPYTRMIMSFTLSKKASGGNEYSVISISRKGVLPDATAKAMQELRKQLKAQCQTVAVYMDDAPASGSAATGPVDVQFTELTGSDEDLPF